MKPFFSLFLQGNKGLLLCCLFFVRLSAVVVVLPEIGDTFFENSFPLRSPVDSSALYTFLDSTGYHNFDSTRVGDTLFVSPRYRLELTYITFTDMQKKDTLCDSIEINRPYQSSLVHTVLQHKLYDFAQRGYPYAELTPTFTSNDSQVVVSVAVTSGPYVSEVELEILSDKKVRSWLITRSLLFDTLEQYDSRAIERSEKKLRHQSYVEQATFLPPEIKGDGDTITVVLPLLYTPKRNLLFDGAIAYQSEGEYHLTGKIAFSLNNIMGFGEQFGFTYKGEGYWQRAHLFLTLPYFAKTPFSLGLEGTIEVAGDAGGYGDASFRIGYDVFDVWQVGFGGHYYEVSDTTHRKQYGGITVDMVRKHGVFQRSLFDWQTLLFLTSGLSGTGQKALFQGTLDFSLLGHFPFGPFAYVGELRGGLTAKDDQVVVDDLEKFRLGGYATIRGYGEELYPSLGFAYNRSAVRWYFSQDAALYLFVDNGVQVRDYYSWGDAYWMMGYGLGVSLPVKSVYFHLEWARHRLESRGLGRIHFSLSN